MASKSIDRETQGSSPDQGSAETGRDKGATAAELAGERAISAIQQIVADASRREPSAKGIF